MLNLFKLATNMYEYIARCTDDDVSMLPDLSSLMFIYFVNHLMRAHAL